MKKIIVSGCSGQLGLVLCNSLIMEGNYVIGLDLMEPDLDHSLFEFHKVNICNKDKVQAFYSAIMKFHPNIDGLVNNAGTAVFSKFEERSEEELLEVVKLNMFAPIYMIQGFLMVAEDNYKSSIVNLASIYGLVAPDQALYIDTPRNSSEIYGMTKAATINLTKYLSVYLSEKKIRCNCISPGGVKFKQGPKFMKAYSEKVPMKRMANQEEIIQAILFLLDSDRASYVNGANLVVDGGFTAWR